MKALMKCGLAILACAASACSSTASDDTVQGSIQETPTGQAGGASIAPPSTPQNPDEGFGSLETDKNPDTTGPTTQEEACTSTKVEGEEITREVEVEVPYEVTEQVPKALYIMLDRSGSMVLDDLCATQAAIPVWGQICPLIFPPGANKWLVAVDGLTKFVNDPGSAELKVALQYFPEAGQCDGSGYDVPAIPMAPLTQNAAPIVSSLGAQLPLGGTPTAGALRGLIRFCESYQQSNPAEQCVGVLITDGEPSECNPEDAGGLGNLAAQANAAGIQIFAAGMAGASFDTLNVIGREGGGDCSEDPDMWACDMTASADAFVEALQRIREQVVTKTRTETRTEVQTKILECEWAIPPPPDGETFNPNLVNVQFSTTSGERSDIGNVPSEADCPNYDGGWFYDNPAAPTRIKVCPQTCGVVQGVSAASVDILLGCNTQPAKLQ